jgi:hypothetical protein
VPGCHIVRMQARRLHHNASRGGCVLPLALVIRLLPYGLTYPSTVPFAYGVTVTVRTGRTCKMGLFFSLLERECIEKPNTRLGFVGTVVDEK